MGRCGYFVVVGLWLLPAVASAQPGADAVARGEYLTNSVAMCVQCHSPRQDDGTLVRGQHFRGGRIPVDGPSWQDGWAITPPDLVALATLRPTRIISVLTTGQRPDGSLPSPPMPPFRFSAEDAKAVVAYLQSLDHQP